MAIRTTDEYAAIITAGATSNVRTTMQVAAIIASAQSYVKVTMQMVALICSPDVSTGAKSQGGGYIA